MKNLAEYNEIVPEDQRKPWQVLVLDEYTDLVEAAGSKDRLVRNNQFLLKAEPGGTRC